MIENYINTSNNNIIISIIINLKAENANYIADFLFIYYY